MWKQYKYRFVPWLALNLKKREQLKLMDQNMADGPTEDEILNQLISLLYLFERNESHRDYFNRDVHKRNCATMERNVGFYIRKYPSKLKNGGSGVVLEKGTVKKGQLVALYPGTVYSESDPLFFQSIGNKFILKCFDGLFIDGNDRFLSKYIYKSCVQRDRTGFQLPADISWLTDDPVNPMAIGQYVNNHTKDFPVNVIYQECNLPNSIPPPMLQLIPNVNFNSLNQQFIRIVSLIAVRDITAGEELFSSYFSLCSP